MSAPQAQQQTESAPTAPSPAPWSARREETVGGESIAVLDANGGVVCLVKNGSGRKRANAQMLAAAPLLRDALILAEGEIHNPGSARAIGKDVVEIIDAALRAAGVPL